MKDNFFTVKVLEKKNGLAEGIVEDLYGKDETTFSGFDDMALFISRRLEGQLRSFSGFPWETCAGKEEDTRTAKGILEIFYIRIFYQQHHSMQGELMWNGHGGEYFRSVLELISLMRSAMGW